MQCWLLVWFFFACLHFLLPTCEVWSKCSRPQSASDYQGMKLWSLLFNIIPLQGNALSSSLFDLAYPFQKEVFFLVPQVLVHCLYDAFIASKLCSMKVGFQFWEQIEVRWGHIRRIWGVRKDFEPAFSRSSQGNLRHVSRRIVMQEQNTSTSSQLMHFPL